MMMDNKMMDVAIKEALKSARRKEGGPFGAVIARKGKIVATGRNLVPKNNDPTAHAEIVAIRKAARKLRRFDLSDCEIYSTCEPCPMCLAAIMWARMKRVTYGATRADAAKIGFDDAKFYRALAGKKKGVPSRQVGRAACLGAMKEWKGKRY
jgi:guanine deaminase